MKRFAPKLHVKKGDKVIVIAGASKGSTGEIKEIFINKTRAIVEGVNMVKAELPAIGETKTYKPKPLKIFTDSDHNK